MRTIWASRVSLQRFNEGTLVLVSEPYAFRYQVKTGDSLALSTPQGWRRYLVGGVFHDYGSDRGMLVLARSHYAVLWSIQTHIPPRLWGDALILAVGAALLAGIYPAWKMKQVQPALALREE